MGWGHKASRVQQQGAAARRSSRVGAAGCSSKAAARQHMYRKIAANVVHVEGGQIMIFLVLAIGCRGQA